jgi:hypothetical protein
MKDLSETKGDIVKKTSEFSGASSTDTTGVIANLNQIKTLITKYNNGMQEITDFNASLLQGYSTTQITQLANTRSGDNINLAGSSDIQSRITKTNEGLESLLNYVKSLNINNV